jgi:DNA-binding IclR family transcriptional regulator
MSTAKLKKDALKCLQEKPISLAELAEKMELKEKKVFRLLRSLFEGGEITSLRGADGIRKYRPTTDEEKAAAKAAAEKAKGGEEVEVDEDEEEDDE